MPRSRRHPIDEEATLDRYEERLRSMPEEAFRELDNAWLETFEVYSTFTGDHIDCAATRLMRVARSYGVNVLGVTSARRTGGKPLCPLILGLPREQAKVVYVGQKNFFTMHDESPFSLRFADRVPLNDMKD